MYLYDSEKALTISLKTGLWHNITRRPISYILPTRGPSYQSSDPATAPSNQPKLVKVFGAFLTKILRVYTATYLKLTWNLDPDIFGNLSENYHRRFSHVVILRKVITISLKILMRAWFSSASKLLRIIPMLNVELSIIDGMFLVLLPLLHHATSCRCLVLMLQYLKSDVQKSWPWYQYFECDLTRQMLS